MSTKKLPAQAEPSDEEEEVASGYVDVQASDNEEDELDDDEQGSEDEAPVSWVLLCQHFYFHLIVHNRRNKIKAKQLAEEDSEKDSGALATRYVHLQWMLVSN